ncbi:MAG: hypothetical protein D6728_12305, partial [Cyanobacteria bacterium J055]
MAPIIYQAETDLTLVDDGNNSYEVNPADYIRVKKKGTTGTATKQFDGADGNYNITIAYLDGDTGDGAIELFIGNTLIQKIDLLANDGIDKTLTINNIPIANGDEIKIIGTREDGDGARVDYIEFTKLNEVADTVAPTVTAFTPGDDSTTAAVDANLSIQFDEG